MIAVDSPCGIKLGFTSDKFERFSYLWKSGNCIYVSMIQVLNEKRGDFKTLVDNILSAGFTIKIPTPLGRMEYIVRKNGYTKTYEMSDEGCVETWVLNSPRRLS